MLDARDGGLRDRLYVQRVRLQLPPALARDPEDGVDQSIHLARCGADESDSFRQVLGRRHACRAQLGIVVVAASRGDISLELADAGLELAGEAHDVHQRRAQVVRHNVRKALYLVVCPAEIGGTFADALLETGIGQHDLLPRSGKFARIGHRHPDGAGGDGNDDERSDDRDPAQSIGGVGLVDHAVVNPLVGDIDELVEKRAGLVHRHLALVGEDDRDGLVPVSVAHELDRAGQFLELSGDGGAHLGDGPRLLRKRRKDRRQAIDQGGNLTHAAFVGFEIALLAGEEIAALAGLGILQGTSEGDGRRADFAAVGRLLEPGPVLLDEPQGCSDDPSQRQKAQDEHDDCRSNDDRDGKRHETSGRRSCL